MDASSGAGARYSRIRAFISLTVLVLMIALPFVDRGHVDPEKPGEERLLYGEYLDWREVGSIFPKYGNATVLDLDTGLVFNIQRRGGTYHADVQPLTAEDTVIMKNIYGGEWSWKRRAVLVTAGGVRIAGSMNGMPHGGGHIHGNDFPGHFCIHFRGSRLHINGREDPAHRIMVLKAAGLLEEVIVKSSAEEVLKIFFTALDQREMNITARTAYFQSPGDLTGLFVRAEQIKKIKPQQFASGGGGSFKISLEIEFNSGVTVRRKEKTVGMVHREDMGWRVDYSTVGPLLTPDRGPDEKVFRPVFVEDVEEEQVME
ncbi:MAG: hypothetical protein ACOY4I_05975 [Bacillota bacterium]